MRFVKPLYKDGDYRVRKAFAFIPFRIKSDDVIETRWLETVYILERYTIGFQLGYWIPKKFVDKDYQIQEKVIIPPPSKI